jgi:hypothetical protein
VCVVMSTKSIDQQQPIGVSSSARAINQPIHRTDAPASSLRSNPIPYLEVGAIEGDAVHDGVTEVRAREVRSLELFFFFLFAVDLVWVGLVWVDGLGRITIMMRSDHGRTPLPTFAYPPPTHPPTYTAPLAPTHLGIDLGHDSLLEVHAMKFRLRHDGTREVEALRLLPAVCVCRWVRWMGDVFGQVGWIEVGDEMAWWGGQSSMARGRMSGCGRPAPPTTIIEPRVWVYIHKYATYIHTSMDPQPFHI